ncbi:energy transducer TonB [bacterium]|nr:energy transducer TonB [candidate division CSSED10-310 bacterium]
MLILLLLIGGISFPPIIHAEDVQIDVKTIPQCSEIRINGILKGECPHSIIVRINTPMQIELFKEGIGSRILDYVVKGNDVIYYDLTTGKRLTETEYNEYLERYEATGHTEAQPEETLPDSNESEENTEASYTKPMPKIIEIPSIPDIPQELNDMTTSGSAVYTIYVDHRGRFQKAEPVKASEVDGLDDYIVSWISKWKFSPALENNFPVAAMLDIRIQYQLPDKIFKVPDISDEEHIAAIAEPKMETRVETTTEKTESKSTEAIPDCSDKTRVESRPKIIQPPKITFIPNEIQNLDLKGSAVYKVSIDSSGQVSDVSIVQSSGNQELDQWLIPFIKDTYWEPATMESKPIACWRNLELSFYTLACRFDFVNIFE